MTSIQNSIKRYSSSPQSLISFMEHSEEHWFIKDTESRYIYMNNTALSYFNVPSGFSMEGRLDKEVPLQSSQDLWPELVEHDKNVIEKTKCYQPSKFIIMERVIIRFPIFAIKALFMMIKIK